MTPLVCVALRSFNTNHRSLFRSPVTLSENCSAPDQHQRGRPPDPEKEALAKVEAEAELCAPGLLSAAVPLASTPKL